MTGHTGNKNKTTRRARHIRCSHHAHPLVLFFLFPVWLFIGILYFYFKHWNRTVADSCAVIGRAMVTLVRMSVNGGYVAAGSRSSSSGSPLLTTPAPPPTLWPMKKL